MTIDHEDILISKAADGCASAEEWDELRRLGAIDPTLWDRLAAESRSCALLAQGLEEATRIADGVEIDASRAAGAAHMRFRLRVWSGWAAAAAVAVVWLGNSILGTGAYMGDTAGFTGVSNADQALDRYRALGTAEGRFVSELPMVMVSSETDPETGRVEVLYLRRILERTEIDGMYTAAEDETGSLMPVPVPVPVGLQTVPSNTSRLY
ncbi:MAG: hypothetical protein ACF8QF_12010 [Phycisphaerales bacterium]